MLMCTHVSTCAVCGYSMAQSQQKVEVVMKGTFPLQVAVRCTEDAEVLCRKNGLSFATLLRPFSQLTTQSKG